MSPRAAIAICLCVLSGCVSSLDRLDAQVDAMIRQRQQENLGGGPAVSPDPVPVITVMPAPPGLAYDKRPPTTNPLPGDLPARPDPSPPSISDEPPPVVEPEPIVLDLQQTLGYAIAHSREYRTQKEELFIAALDLVVERHLWGPRFFNDTSVLAVGTPESGDYEQAVDILNSFRVTQRLPYGGEVSARALVGFVDRLRDTLGNDPSPTQDASVGLSVAFPILRGAGLVAQESLIQAERDLVYATRQFERFRREFLVDISSTYYSLLQSRAVIENLKRQVANFEWLSRRIKALADAGREPYFEVQRAEQQVLFARNNLINATENYQSALDRFKLRLGMPTVQPLELKPAEVVIPEPSLDVDHAIAAAMAYRLDLQTTRDQIGDAQRGVAVAKNQLLPDLDLVADLSLNTDPARRTPGLDLDLGSSRYTAGVTFGAPLDRRIEQAGYRRSLVSLERSQRAYAEAADTVALQVRSSVRRIEQARFTLELQNRNIEVASTRLRGVLLRLRELGPRDFIEAQEDLLEARNRRDVAIRDLRVSVLNYLLDTGQMRVSPLGLWLAPGQLVPSIEDPQPATPGQLLQPPPPPPNPAAVPDAIVGSPTDPAPPAPAVVPLPMPGVQPPPDLP